VDLAAASAAAIARGAQGADIGRAVQRARLAALQGASA
jgi:tRNA nucleotidyltransferase (CCA-adding enzyme)